MTSSTSAACFYFLIVAAVTSATCFYFLIVAAVTSATAEGNNTPAPAEDCTSLVMQMADCLSYVTNATVEKPEGNCCSGLKMVLKKKAECLCEVFQSSAQFGITVNVTKAVSIPSACHVRAPSVAKCGISISPAGAPAGSPTGTPTANPPSSGTGTGTSAPPASAPSVKGYSSTTRVSFGPVLVLMAAVYFSSSY